MFLRQYRIVLVAILLIVVTSIVVMYYNNVMYMQKERSSRYFDDRIVQNKNISVSEINKNISVSEINKNISISSFNDVLQKIINKCPITEETIKRDLVMMRDKVVPLFTKKTKSLPDYTYGELFLLEDHPIRGRKTTIDWIIDDLNYRCGLELCKRTVFQEIDSNLIQEIFIAKKYFNKPRPIVTSKRYGVDVHCYDMESAKSPALPSGHAAHSMMIGAMIYALRRFFFNRNENELRNLSRKCLEIGFRRVVGGVHYPDDVRGAAIFVRYATQSWGVERICDMYDEYVEIGFTRGIDTIWDRV